MEDFIKVEDLIFEYVKSEDGTAVRAIDSVSFSVERGSFTAVIGQNGSGKSTLLSLICADNPQRMMWPLARRIWE